MRIPALLFLFCTALLLPAEDRVIHVFVALCDNASQGIQPVPAKIGNGDDPAANLYWGCSDALPPLLRKSKSWKQTALIRDAAPGAVILERAIFRHRTEKVWLVADAYRGREIRKCLSDYFASLGGHLAVNVNSGEQQIRAGGAADLIGYIGHDGLMEFDVEVKSPAEGAKPKPAVALCCISARFFAPKLRVVKAEPLLLTTQLMYPGGFLMEAAAAGWIAGETAEACRGRAARAYAANQRIRAAAAAGVFTSTLPPEPAAGR